LAKSPKICTEVCTPPSIMVEVGETGWFTLWSRRVTRQTKKEEVKRGGLLFIGNPSSAVFSAVGP